MTDVSKLLPMGSESGMGRSKRSTQPGADVHPGRALDGAARRKKRHTYLELLRPWRCRLVVVGVEVAGRFGAEAATWLRLLARHRASAASAATRPAAQSAWVARSGLVAVAAQSAFAASLLELPGSAMWAGRPPDLNNVFADDRWQLPVPANRLGPRQHLPAVGSTGTATNWLQKAGKIKNGDAEGN